MNVFMLWIPDIPPGSGIRRRCMETVTKRYPGAVVYRKEYIKSLFCKELEKRSLVWDRKFDNNVLLCDYFRILVLSRTPDSLYFDTDIELLSSWDTGEYKIRPYMHAIGWNGYIGCNCILYNGGGVKQYQELFERWITAPQFLMGPTQYAIMNTNPIVLKDGYIHHALGCRKGWANE